MWALAEIRRQNDAAAANRRPAHAERGFAVLVTADPGGGRVPRFAGIGPTPLVRPRHLCRTSLAVLKGRGLSGRVVRVRVASEE